MKYFRILIGIFLFGRFLIDAYNYLPYLILIHRYQGLQGLLNTESTGFPSPFSIIVYLFLYISTALIIFLETQHKSKFVYVLETIISIIWIPILVINTRNFVGLFFTSQSPLITFLQFLYPNPYPFIIIFILPIPSYIIAVLFIKDGYKFLYRKTPFTLKESSMVTLPVNQLVFPYCGSINPNDMNYCGKCGKNLILNK